MTLNEIDITNYKNIARASLQFSPKINCLLGANGMGKSNLLDAIYFLSFCKSFTGCTDALAIAKDEDFAMVQAKYTRSSTLADEQLTLALQRGRRKSLKRAGKEYKRLSQHIGAFPLVLVSPADMDLVNGSGEERRKFMDMVISQTDPVYLDALIRYGHLLEQRNKMLRDSMDRTPDPALFAAVEMQMEAVAATICRTRAAWTERLSKIFASYYADIAGEGETPQLVYTSHLADPETSLCALFDQRRTRDSALGYTTAGPHRDDIDMLLSDMPLRRCASQGQAKTYTIALRLAQYDFLKQAVGLSPLLLLDDIFDKLDASRVERIMAVASRPGFGQIFITDTNRKHLDEILSHSGGHYAMWTVQGGEFTPTLPLQ